MPAATSSLAIPLRAPALAVVGGLLALAACQAAPSSSFSTGRAGDAGPKSVAVAAPPEWLSETGLFEPGKPDALRAGVVAYSPQYPLWTDGAQKRRWLWLPPGTAIDARDPDAWVFPPGTRLWKEFRFGRRVETRFMQAQADGRFAFATYVWREDGQDAERKRGETEALQVAPGQQHDVPGESDCVACHGGRPSGVLGLSALQLSSDRDPAALHASPLAAGEGTLEDLVARGLLEGLPATLRARPPRIPARTPRERAVLGYLHGNCAGCHNAQGPVASLGLHFDQPSVAPASHPDSVLPSAIGVPSRYRIAGQTPTLRIAPGDPERSAVVHRMSTRFAAAQMPPLGTHVVDAAAVARVREWIEIDLAEVAKGEEK